MIETPMKVVILKKKVDASLNLPKWEVAVKSPENVLLIFYA